MTVVKSKYFPSNSVSIVSEHDTQVGLEVRNGYVLGIKVERNEFAQAVRDLGFVVIDKAELPEVTRDGAYIEVDEEATPESWVRANLDTLKSAVYNNLALIAWAEKNPPIDPKVEALAELLEGVSQNTHGNFADLARKLFATGRLDVKEAS